MNPHGSAAARGEVSIADRTASTVHVSLRALAGGPTSNLIVVFSVDVVADVADV